MNARTAAILSALVVILARPLLADDVQHAAARVDRLIKQRWEEEGATPAPLADDAEFMRRVYLDLAGKIPPVMEVREFLADESPDKRQRLVARLLDSPNYVAHFSKFWTNVLIPEAAADIQLRFLQPGFEAWLREKLELDSPYDAVVREILTVPFQSRQQPQINQFVQPSPSAFYRTKQSKPENLAAATARTFLGIRIECAQCHDHPFDTWQRQQFWSTAAFFASIQGRAQQSPFAPLVERESKHDIKIPDTETVVQAKFVTGEEPDWQEPGSPRVKLANWVTAKNNPYFARAAVNRIWGQMFGRGIVEPVDDFSPNNPPSHPELLDELAAQFANADFDLKFILRVIVATETYQLSSQRTDASQDDPSLFAKMNLRGLTSQQLINSLAQATGFYEAPMQRMQRQFSFNQNDVKSELLQAFQGSSESALDRQTTIIQALAMMNGGFTTSATGAANNQTLGAILDYPGMGTGEKIEALYLATLSRPPREEELDRLSTFVEQGGTTAHREALGHVFWALLNSSEFMFNH